MARVPLQELRSVAPQATQFVPQSSREATAETFGSLETAEAFRSGQQLSAAGDQLAQISLKLTLEDNERESKRGDTTIRRNLNLLLHGDGTLQNPGYLSTANDEAISQHAATIEAINSIVAQQLDGAGNSNIAAGISAGSSIPVTSAMELVAKHANEQRRSSSMLTIERRQEQAQNDAAADSSRMEESKVIAGNEARAICALQNLDGEQCDGPVLNAISEVIDATVRGELARANVMIDGVSGIERAEAIFEEAKRLNEINGLARTPLEKAIFQAKVSRIELTDKFEARETRLLKKKQDETLGNLEIQIRRGSPEITTDDINNAFLIGDLDRAGMEKAHKFKDVMASPSTADHPHTLIALSASRDGDTLTKDDLDNALLGRRLTPATYAKELERLNNPDRLLDKPIVKRLRKSLVEFTVGGLPSNIDVMDPGSRERAFFIAEQFDTRVLEGEDPQKVSDSLRANPSFFPVRSLTILNTPGEQNPDPLFSSGIPGNRNQDDFANMYDRTEEAFDNGRISEEKFNDELDIIRDLEKKSILPAIGVE